MFWQDENNLVVASFFSTFYLGRARVCEAVLALLDKHRERFWPERWGTDERTRSTVIPQQLQAITEEWIRPASMKQIHFSRKRPDVALSFAIERFPRAKFNNVTLWIRDKYVKDRQSLNELLAFSIELCSIVQADYGFIAHAEQERRQSPVLTPAERLPGIYWANFFGRPYIDFFGRQKLLGANAHEIRRLNDSSILLLTAETPTAPEMIDNDLVATQLKTYLNQNAFPGPNFPQEPCSVPVFDFSDVRWTDKLADEPPVDQKIALLREDLEAKGFVLVEESNGQLVFRGPTEFIVRIDQNKGEISVDATGRFLQN